MILFVKTIIALVSNLLGISKHKYNKLNKENNNNYVRVLNYHYVPNKNLNDLKKQISFYNKKFKIIDYKEFKDFLDKKIQFIEKPALLVTFDDGEYDNYIAAKEVLDPLNVKALFFVCGNRIINDDNRYLKVDHIKEMLKNGHSIGNHTKNHYRINENDTKEKLIDEIVESEKIINQFIGYKCDSFCWVGGEDEHYTRNAFNIIKENYDYVFCTNTQITAPFANHQYIQRTNVEAFWNMQLIKFQVSGVWDSYYTNKYKRIAERLEIKI